MKRQLRAISRLPKLLGVAGRLLWDVYVRKVEGEEKEATAKKFYHGLANVFGIKIVFNQASAPMEKDFPTLFTANHMSVADFIVLGSVLNGTFAGKELGLPPKMLDAANYIGIKRVPKDHPDFRKNVRRTLGQFITNLNNDVNTIFFAEGTTTDGSIVAQPRAALFKGSFGEKGLDANDNEVGYERDIRVQPVAMKVTDVEGHNVDMRPEKRHYYSHYTSDSALSRIWTRLCTESITVEVTVLPSVDPKKFADEKVLANEIFNEIRGIVAPEQTVVEPAKIPGVLDRGEVRAEEPPKRGMY